MGVLDGAVIVEVEGSFGGEFWTSYCNQLAVLPQYTFRADRQTDRQTHGISDRFIARAAYA